MNPEVLIIGCGFLGEAAAELFSSRGRRVLGLVRSPESLSSLTGRLFASAACDVTIPDQVESLIPRLQGVPLAIYAVSSGRGGPEAYEAVYRDGLQRVLDAWKPGKTIFVSSTSVYGQADGSEVTEESPAVPDRETGRILIEAENIVLSAGGCAARLSGIYGPGRSVLLKKFLSGEAVLEAGGQRWINQIHREDAVSALAAMGQYTSSGEIYNVSDDTPVTQREIYGWMADFLKRPMPPEGPADLLRKRGWTSKRVCNRKLQNIGWTPRFPSYRDALPQLLASLKSKL